MTGSVASYKQVEVTGSVTSDKQVEVKEVSRIRLHAQDKGGVQGMVVYNQRVHVVHGTGLIVYCYTPDGSLSHQYEHKGGENANITGMCLMIDGDTAMLVVCDISNNTIVRIRLIDEVTMDHHHTEHLSYHPYKPYNDRGDLMVCDPDNHKIHRYRHNGQTLAVIMLPDNVSPWKVARHGDGNHYVVIAENKQVLIIDGRGQVKTHYKGDIQGVKLICPRDVITDPHGGVLIADFVDQVLLLRRTGDVVKILENHVILPTTLYLDTDHHRLYVSGKDLGLDQHRVWHSAHNVFVFNYTNPTGKTELTMKITKLDMKMEI